MENIVVSTIPINDLVKLVASEVVEQITQYIEKPVQPESKRLFGDKEAADYLGCSPLTIQKLRNTRQITYYRYGRKCYFLSNELDEALKVPRKFGEKNRKGSL